MPTGGHARLPIYYFVEDERLIYGPDLKMNYEHVSAGALWPFINGE